MGEAALDIDHLSTEERLDLLEKLWDSLSEAPSRVPVTDAQRQELDQRLQGLEQDIQVGRDLGIPWDEVLRQIRSRR